MSQNEVSLNTVSHSMYMYVQGLSFAELNSYIISFKSNMCSLGPWQKLSYCFKYCAEHRSWNICYSKTFSTQDGNSWLTLKQTVMFFEAKRNLCKYMHNLTRLDQNSANINQASLAVFRNSDVISCLKTHVLDTIFLLFRSINDANFSPYL